MLLARREERLRELADELGAEYELCDVTDRDAVAASEPACSSGTRALGLLVNNAGVPARATFLQGDPAAIENAMRTNYLGSVWCLRAFLPGLEAGAPSDVVNVVSVAGTVTLPQSGPYAASKHAQLAFSRAVAAELRARRIRVHTVKPGFVETEGFPQSWLPGLAQRLVLRPEQVAEHIAQSLERGRGETTVPRYYAAASALQALAPNLLARVLARRRADTRIDR